MIKSELKKKITSKLYKNRPDAVNRFTKKLLNRCMDYIDGLRDATVKVEPVNEDEWDSFILESTYKWIEDKI